MDLEHEEHAGEDRWELEFRANTENIIGDSGNELDLEYIYLVAKDPNEDGITVYEAELTSQWQTLVEGNKSVGFDDFKILITYKCGRDPKEEDKILLGEPPGYYYVDIEFKVEAY